MASYTVHIKRRLATADPDRAHEAAVFIRDGWNWGAFGFGPFWLLGKGHLLLGAAALILQFGMLALLALLGLRPEAALGISVLLALFWGLEGPSLRRLGLRLGRHDEVSLVVATSEDEAERRFFDALPTARDEAAPPMPSGFVPHGTGNPVMGLFPTARGTT